MIRPNPYRRSADTPIFGASQSTIRFAELMNQGKAILVNLSRNHLKESRGLFGALIMAKLALAILSRESIPPAQRRPFVIFADEAHEYFIPEFALTIAAGARKFMISYRLFSQSPSQYGEAFDTLTACCATHMAFSLDRKGAERLARELFSVTGQWVKYQAREWWGLPKGRPETYSIQEEAEHAINELMSQGMGECYIRSKGPADTGHPWMAGIPKVIYPSVDLEQEETFKAASAAIYCRSLADIIAAVTRAYGLGLSEVAEPGRSSLYGAAWPLSSGA